MHRVNANRIRAHITNQLEPRRVRDRIRKLRRLIPRNGGADVHAFDVERLPVSAVANFEMLARDSGRILQRITQMKRDSLRLIDGREPR